MLFLIGLLRAVVDRMTQLGMYFWNIKKKIISFLNFVDLAFYTDHDDIHKCYFEPYYIKERQS